MTETFLCFAMVIVSIAMKRPGFAIAGAMFAYGAEMWAYTELSLKKEKEQNKLLNKRSLAWPLSMIVMTIALAVVAVLSKKWLFAAAAAMLAICAETWAHFIIKRNAKNLKDKVVKKK